MNKIVSSLALACLCLTGAVAAAEPAELTTPKQRFSYGLGLQIAQSLLSQGVTDVDVAAIAQALSDRYTGVDPRLSVEDLAAAAQAFQQEMLKVRMGRAEESRMAGEAFLGTNKNRDGVLTLDSGLQYMVHTEGAGEQPSETDTVVVHYRGSLLDGSEFDSSHKRGEPATLQVGQVIPGWQQALQMMPVGSKWEIWIPSDLAYGLRGAGAAIGPNETLHFEIELLEIKAE